MSSSFKGYWINGSKEAGYTAEKWKENAIMRHAPEVIERRPTITAIRNAIAKEVAAAREWEEMEPLLPNDV